MLSRPAPETGSPARPVSLPAVPAVAVNARQAVVLNADGEIALLSRDRAQAEIGTSPVLACHAPYTRQRLGVRDLLAFDVLELFAFVHPAQFCVPTPAGLCRALGLPAPDTFEDYPFSLVQIAQALLRDIQAEARTGRKTDPLEVAGVMGLQGKGWNWTPFVFAALGQEYDADAPVMAKTALNVWRYLPEWSEGAPPPPPAHSPVTGEESRRRLEDILSRGGATEIRPQQKEYATALTAAFAPMQQENEPHLVLAEAGTGVGKTLGYLAPASVWAEKNDGSVWISTYTKNLQRQIGQELARVYPDPDLLETRVAVRKGRENYLCLLNLEDAAGGAALARNPVQAIAAGLMARWAEVTKDGDMQGGDFPGWLPGLLGHMPTRGLADRRGECIYAACDHYHKCFIERAVRKSRHADIVVANHALVMRQTADSGTDSDLPRRYVFDEGHHLFDAADSAFAAHLTARETAELRRWILGAEDSGKRSRARGLKRRLEDLVAGDAEAETQLQSILHAAHLLAGPGWSRRLKDESPQGSTEEFIALVHKQVQARAPAHSGPYSLETQARPMIDGLPAVAAKLKSRLRDLQKPMKDLATGMRRKLGENAATWDSDTRRRVEAICTSLGLRLSHVEAWINMLETLGSAEDAPGFVDWMEIVKVDGHAWDVGMYRHYVDPMVPFAASIRPHAHGIAVTSATLRDRTGEEAEEWKGACERTGAGYLTGAPAIFSTPSPYDYADRTRIFIVNDVRRDDMDQVAAAYRVLFEAAGGGALGLFTAIQRLRAVQERILSPLEERGIRLYAQHIDAMDTGTLVDIFREDMHACLLGTDAVRDGIDVPGDSLRLLVYDRVPWPRPTILHKARRDAFGKQRYDDMNTRFRLRQAYGRLIRRETDRGVFVMLDSMLPSRLLTAFPEGVAVEKTGLADCAARIRDFLE